MDIKIETDPVKTWLKRVFYTFITFVALTIAAAAYPPLVPILGWGIFLLIAIFIWWMWCQKVDTDEIQAFRFLATLICLFLIYWSQSEAIVLANVVRIIPSFLWSIVTWIAGLVMKFFRHSLFG